MNQFKKRKGKFEKIVDLLKYANEQYGCKFPKNFAAILYNISYMGQIPGNCVIDAIYEEWKVWKPYLQPYSFHYFFQNELKMMFSLQTASIFSSPTLNAYIGNKATLKEDAELPLLTTTITWKGQLLINGKEKT